MRRLGLVLLCAALLFGGCAPADNRTAAHAEERVRAFAEAVNYRHAEPAAIYAYLTSAYKARMSEAAFCEAFAKERSYPYLVPLFLNYRTMELSGDGLSGVAHFSQAARLPGMSVDIPFVYENGDYYMIAFEAFPDGSYLEKFEDIPYSLDMYYDLDEMDKD